MPLLDVRALRTPFHTRAGLATAVGGASVVLQADGMPVHSGGIKPTAREPVAVELNPRFVPCRCQGGNKDCCFCGGRGYYAKH